jgi:hypothetical protein
MPKQLYESLFGRKKVKLSLDFWLNRLPVVKVNTRPLRGLRLHCKSNKT